MISRMRTSSQRSHRPESVSGSRSFANPGSIPDVKQDVSPLRHASSSLSRTSGKNERGCTSGTIELDTTFFPDARMRQMSSTASNGRRSAVAV